MKKKLLIAMLILIGAGLILVGMIAAVNVHMVSYTDEYIFKDISQLPEAAEDSYPTSIVLGAYVYDSGYPCPMLVDRLENGINAYNEGKTTKILLSGDHGTKGYDEVNAMKTYTFNKDIHRQDVFLDHAGFSTYDSMIRASEIFRIKDAVISTQGYHLVRAVYIARRRGMNAYGVEADLRRYPRSEMVRYLVREWLARFKDFIFVNILKPDPVFLGDEIPISGSSTASYDKPEDSTE